MAGETMQAMPMSPRQSPTEIGSAAVQWVCTRRGRTFVMGIVLFMILMGLGGVQHHEVGFERSEGSIFIFGTSSAHGIEMLMSN